MFDYLQQFNKLPKELREKVSSPAAMEILSSLETKYGVSLAMVVMQVMIKQIPVRDLTTHFISELGLSAEKAQALSRELQERLFFAIATYLGLRMPVPLTPEEKELEALMKDNGIVLASQDLVARCRQIMNTYRRGVRTKIDARSALERPVNQGGLALDAAAADRLLRAMDRPVGSLAPANNTRPVASAALNELINKNEAATYDFKTALAKGEIKPPAALAERFKKLDPTHEIEAADKELALKAPEERLKLEKENVKPVAPIVEKPKEPAKAPEIRIPIIPIPPAPVSPIAPVAPVVPVVPAPAPIPTPSVPPVMPRVVPVAPVVPLTATPKEAENKAPSISKPVAAKAGIWSKLFKADAPAPAVAAAAAISSTKHLEEAVKAAVAQNNVIGRSAASSDSRPKIEDVRLKPKVMGPLEELRYLDLVNFRRLGNNPKEITGKIVMKIHLLEKDGYDRMVEGVKAWRQSPVNRLYVRLTQEAVVKGVTLREAVAARQAENKEILTMEEIEAIVAMNTQLMF